MNDLITKDFTQEQLKLITDTVAKGATPDELKLFLYRCKNLGLDPLKPGHIHFIKYGAGSGTIVVGIDGFRARAQSTGKLSGIKRGALRNAKGELVGAYAEVYRSDWKECAREEVPFQEYNTGKGPWAKMPETMIKKVAEAAALRMAFPDALGGIYTHEEMDQAGIPQTPPRIAPEQPPSDNGDGITNPSSYRVPFGKWKGRSIEELYRMEGPENLSSYLNYLEDTAEKKGQPLGDMALELIKQVETYLGDMENRYLDPASNPPIEDFDFDKAPS